jgi:hypothetical protein
MLGGTADRVQTLNEMAADVVDDDLVSLTYFSGYTSSKCLERPLRSTQCTKWVSFSLTMVQRFLRSFLNFVVPSTGRYGEIVYESRF